MEQAVYERMNELEEDHWWFSARRDIIRSTLKRLIRFPLDPVVLEAGCGTGGNLKLLAEFGQLDAFEYDQGARDIAEKKSGLSIPFGALPDQIPFADKRYDLIGLFDVLEHVEKDQEALIALGQRLKPTGRLVVTVPAFQWLWSKHDERHHHFRRYTRLSLQAVVNEAGLSVEHSFYFNSFLFPAAVVTRGLKALLGRDTPDDKLPAPWLNKSMYKVFSTERHLVGRMKMPLGLSLGAIIKPTNKSA